MPFIPHTLMGQATPSFDSKFEFPTPIVSSTSPFDDTIIVERISKKLENYVPLPYGTPHPSFAGHLLSFQQELDDGESALRFYAAVREDQDTYNASMSYVDEDDTSPIYSRDYLILRTDYAALAELTADPVDPGAFLTHQEMLAEPTDPRLKGLFVATRRVYKTLPGPWVVSRKRLRTNVIEQTRKRLVAATTIPGAGGGAVTQTGIQGVSVAEAYQYEISWTDDNGTPLGANPIFVTEEIIDEDRVIFKHYVQEVPSSAVAPVLNAEDGTSYIWASDGITSVTVVSPGSTYITVPTVSVANPRGGGVAATFTVRMKAMTATISALGSNYAAGDTVTLTGGTSTQAVVLTISAMSLSTLAVNAVGSGYLPGQTITLAGGTFTTAGVVTIATASLFGITPDGVGAEYVVGDTITLAGGTFSVAAIVEVVTLLISGLQVDNGGEDYIPGEVITLAGGTSTTPAQVTVATLGVVEINVVTSGFLYQIGDLITLTGGVFTIACVIEVTEVAFNSCSLLDPGTGYAPGDTITLAGGTFSAAAQITVATVGGSGEILTFTVTSSGIYSATVDTYTQGATSGVGVNAEFNLVNYAIYNASIATAGSYTGLVTFPTQGSTSGSGTGAQIEILSWKAVTVTISNSGNYTVVPATFTQASSTSSGTGATFNAITAGVRSVTVDTAGSYSASGDFTQGSTDGIGFGETFSSPSFSVLTVTVTTPGSYTVTSTTFTQGSTSGTGTGATFQSATFTAGSATITTPGSYSVLPSNPVSQASSSGAGTGATWTIGWGVLSVTVVSGGSGYTTPNPSVTFTPAGAIATAVVDAASWRSATAYIIGGKLADKQDSSNKIKTWTTSPVPPDKVRYISMGYEFPGTINVINNSSFIGSRPSPGVNYNGYRAHKKATFPARETTTYQRGAFSPADIPEVFALITPAAGSAFFPIGPNFVHNGFTFTQIQSDGTVVYTETFPASTPSYAVGDEVTAAADSKVWRGDMWAMRVVVISETAPASLTPPAWSKGADSGATS